MREIIVDNFAGGGGASTGIEMATGRSVDIAINHDENAIAMHTTNHPNTLHYCESVFDIDPVAATAGRPVGLVWFSPDCRHFSKAKGGTPVKKEIRGLAWIVIRWALRTNFRCGMLENVEEFKTWGPLNIDAQGNGFPCPARKGETFKAFVAMLSTGIVEDHPALDECCDVLGIAADSDDRRRLVAGLGYNVDHRELRANLIGAPTIRKRFFMVIRRDGQPIRWPAQTHDHWKSAAVRNGKMQAEPTMAECIDWSIATRSIFGRKKDLAGNTLRRIVKGIQRYVLDCPDPFIVQIGQTGFGGDGRQYEIRAPLTTVTSKAEHLLIEPFGVKCNHTSSKTKYDCFRGQSGRLPLQTVTQTHGFAVAAPVVVKQFGKSTAQSADAPAGTVMPGGGGKMQLASAVLVGAGGPTYSGKPRSVYAPAPTIPTESHAALAAVNLIKHYGGNYTGAGLGMDEPAHTITQVDHHALCTSHLVQLRGTCKDGRPTNSPAPTLTAGGNHVGHVQAFITKYYGTASAVGLDGPTPAVTTKDRLGLTEVQCETSTLTEDQRYGAWWCARLMEKFSDAPDDSHLFPAPRPQYLRVGEYVIVDICMRMLQPPELYRAQGFPSWYIIDRDYRGKKYSKAQQTARCGNSVPPLFAKLLVEVNLPEMCTAKEDIAA
ncbi:DNA cytosine methyltransferase [Serratia marcescens]|uniref:DNA cytosine methyltransferase n=1 Tax=Serratia marcescens TaxID=615 RepID=UPI00221FCD0A|nr:DNA cytosine methyltransferase [Serratia marcescens]UYU01872.1 DNA cytosine methyltransferase [Serratia marcescens]HEJ7901957.1 DNA cytosine methyltransferase [Serratia marcescens]